MTCDGAFWCPSCERIFDPLGLGSTVCLRCLVELASDDARWDAYDEEEDAIDRAIAEGTFPFSQLADGVDGQLV